MGTYLNKITLTGDRASLESFDNNFKKVHTLYDMCYNEVETIQEIVETLQKDGYKNVGVSKVDYETNIACLAYSTDGYSIENIIPSKPQVAVDCDKSMWVTIKDITTELFTNVEDNKLIYTFYTDEPLAGEIIKEMASIAKTTDLTYIAVPSEQSDTSNKSHLEIQYSNSELLTKTEYNTLHSRRTFMKKHFPHKYMLNNCTTCYCPITKQEVINKPHSDISIQCPCCETQLKYTPQ